MIRFSSLLVLLGTSAFAERPAERNAIRVDLPYQARRSDPRTHTVDFSVVVTPPYGCKVLKVWLPLPPSDAGQTIANSRIDTFPTGVKPRIATERVYGNRFAYFEFHKPQGAQIIRHRFTAKVWNLHWGVDPDKVDVVGRWPQAFEPYLKPQAIVEQDKFDRTLASIVPHKRGAGHDLLSVMGWIDGNLTYDHAAGSLNADAGQAFSQLRGHCSDYHGLCATMGRSLGYPSRVTYGLSLYPKNSPSHCKLEAFLPPYGWVSFDLSETQKLVAAIAGNERLSDAQKQRLTALARSRLHRGFRENSWLLLTRGTGYDLAPKAAKPVRVVRTIYAEADGTPLPEPDPANAKQRKFAWMTVHKYTVDRPFTRPFKEVSTLEDGASATAKP